MGIMSQSKIYLKKLKTKQESQKEGKILKITVTPLRVLQILLL